MAELGDAQIETEVRKVLAGQDNFALPRELVEDREGSAADRSEDSPLYLALREMSVPQKIKLALFGNQTARALLVRDRNKQVQQFVLQNGRITENEVTEFARNTNLSDVIYRGIAANQSWMKSYAVKVNLVSNPRVPIDISLKLVRYLHPGDLKKLAKSKGIPQVLASQCQKMIDKHH